MVGRPVLAREVPGSNPGGAAKIRVNTVPIAVLVINKDMALTDTISIDADVNIFIEVDRSNYRLRYEIRKSITEELTQIIRDRMSKSFSLGRNYPDAYTEVAIQQKANLMQTIFTNEYGLSSSIII